MKKRVGNRLVPRKLFVGGAKGESLVRTSIDQLSGSAPTGVYGVHDNGESEKAMLGFSWSRTDADLHLAVDYSENKFGRASPVFITSGTFGVAVDFK